MQPLQPKLIFVCKSEPFFHHFTPEQYVEYSQITYILSQASKVFLRKPQTTPTTILSEFFQQYIRGQHVLLKSYNNFQKSSFSKLCFVSNFSKIFEIEEPSFGERTGFDYLQLIRLVCSDFPKEYIINSLKLSSGDFDYSEQLLMDKIIKGELFTKGLFMSCMYSEFIKDIQAMGNVKIEKLLEYLREAYKNKRMQFELPGYKVVMDTLLKCSPISPNSTSSGITFVSDDNITSYLPIAESINAGKYLNALYFNDLNDREVSERLEFFDVLNLRVTQITKLLDNKDDTAVITKTKKKKK